MGLLCRGAISTLLYISFAACALAQNGNGAAEAVSPETTKPALTGKERLGPKWTDEQRIDNCKVPIDKRGTKPRPSLCSNAPPS